MGRDRCTNNAREIVDPRDEINHASFLSNYSESCGKIDTLDGTWVSCRDCCFVMVMHRGGRETEVADLPSSLNHPK